MTVNPDSIESNFCANCEGRGYFELRDCTGEIQREETCSFCEGTGTAVDIDDKNGRLTARVLPSTSIDP